jgi:hypothetical protein
VFHDYGHEWRYYYYYYYLVVVVEVVVAGALLGAAMANVLILFLFRRNLKFVAPCVKNSYCPNAL